jgi:hypothetical protein
VEDRTVLPGGEDLGVRIDTGNRVSALAAAGSAYGFFLRRFGQILRLLMLPILAACFTFYIGFDAYLAELKLFLESENPRVASLALGSLAAGIFVPLFCLAIGVGAISRLAVGEAPVGWRSIFWADRSEWRLYAAYLRLLVLIVVVIVLSYFAATHLAPLLAIPRRLGAWMCGITGGAIVFWLCARVGLTIAPVVAASEGPVLRRAWRESRRDNWRNSWLIVLLLIPGMGMQFAGEYVLRLGAAVAGPSGNPELADYVQLMDQTLARFVAAMGLSSLVTLALLTLGGMVAYRHLHPAGLSANPDEPTDDLSPDYPVLGETLRE